MVREHGQRHDQSVLHLGDLELFANASEVELRRVEELARGLEVEAGSVLCREGEIGDAFFVIIEGSANVSIGGSVFAHLGPGSGFGEIALVSSYDRRVATVSAATPMRLLTMDRAEFTAALTDVPSFARALLRETANRLAEVQRTDGSDKRLIARP